MSDVIRSCRASEPALRVGDRILSLYLTNLLCEDETEHDGFGEGVANDAIRFSGLVTTQKGNAPPSQCKIPTKNLGDNYQDGTSVALNEEVFSILLSATDRYPVVVNVTFVLGEEDWGGKFENAVDEIVSLVSRVAKESTTKAVTTAVGAAIGTAFGPYGTVIGAGIGAAVGFVVEGITELIRSLESDAFPPKDISLALQSSDASFAGDDPSRHIDYLRFEGLGGQYLLTYEWRLQSATTYSNVYGQPFAVARKPEQLDLFVVGNDSRVYTSWWTGGVSDWSGINNNWRPIGGTFPAGAPVSAVARKPEQLDLFVVGNDGRVYTSWWVLGSDWSGINNNWRPIGGTFPAGAPVSAVARKPEQLDLFVVGNDGRVYTSWWVLGSDWSGINNNWRPIGGTFPLLRPR